LKIEYEARNADLKKLENAEERMSSEVKNLNEKIQKMEEEIE